MAQAQVGHELVAAGEDGSYSCECGLVGESTRAYAGEQLRPKAIKAWWVHARRATGKITR